MSRARRSVWAGCAWALPANTASITLPTKTTATRRIDEVMPAVTASAAPTGKLEISRAYAAGPPPVSSARHRPGVHGRAGLGGGHVAAGHLGERGVARQPARLQRGQRAPLPDGAGDAGGGARGDDARGSGRSPRGRRRPARGRPSRRAAGASPGRSPAASRARRRLRGARPARRRAQPAPRGRSSARRAETETTASRSATDGARPRIPPTRNAALASMSSRVGPAASARSSIRRWPPSLPW